MTGDSGLKVAVECARRAEFWLLMAGSGSSKDICNDESCLVPSFPWISVEEAGVGGNAALGMLKMGWVEHPLRWLLWLVRTVMKPPPRYQELARNVVGQPCDTTELIELAILGLAN